MSVNDTLESAFIRHQIFVQRYAKGREREAEAYIRRLIRGISSELGRGDNTVYTQARLSAQLTDMQNYMTRLSDDYQAKLYSEIIDFANYEAEFNTELLRQNVGNYANFTLPSSQLLEAAMFTDVMQLEPNKGYTIANALRNFDTKKQTQIIQQIRDGIIKGSTTSNITKAIVAIGMTQRRQAATLARTIINRVSTVARTTTMRENSDVISHYKWVATLDSFTSLICMGLDGKIFKDLKKNPKPPAHFNCRSTISYIVKPEFNLGKDVKGTRPSVGADNKAKLVSDDTNYAKWLRTQPKAFQDEVLGKGKASIFRSGKVKLDKFVDANGRPLSLAQLRALERSMGGTGGAGGVPLAQVVQAAVVTPKATPIEKALKEIFEETQIVSQVSGYTAEQIKKDMYNALLPNLSTLTAQVVAKAPKLKNLRISKKEGGSYSYHHQRLNLKAGTVVSGKEVTTHEYGHYIADMLSKAAKTRSRANIDPNSAGVRLKVFMPKHANNVRLNNDYLDISSMDKRFTDAFKKDRKALWKNATEKAAFGKAWQDMTWKEVQGKRAGYRALQRRDEYKSFGWSSVEDILDAMSLGQFRTRLRTFSGHGVSYYREKGMKEAETWAQLFTLHKNNNAASRKARELFPNLFKAFEDILEDYLKYY